MFKLFAQFDLFRTPNLHDPLITPAIELRDADGVYLRDSDGKQLVVTA